MITSSDHAIAYHWKDIPNHAHLNYMLDATVRTTSFPPPITKKIPFPLTTLEPQFLKYTKPSEFIDITPAIEKQASLLASTEKDLFAIVFAIADWTKNTVHYDLSTLTASAVQKSSWVLENKQGVCDEITNLFISFLRSLGIPAKFVSGMVYSNLDHKWGPHGWAEVYFPGYGWLPFDVTFGQYGWLDASHIKLKDDTDSGSPSAEYSWKATSEDNLDISEATLSTTLLAPGKQRSPMLITTIEAYKKALGPSSVIPLLVTLENPTPNYLATSIILRKAPGVQGSNVKQILLKPKETKTTAWLLTIPKEVEPNIIYTSLIEVETIFGNTATTEIKYSKDYDAFSEQQAQAIIQTLEDQAEKTTIETIDLSCLPDKTTYYANDPVTVSCTITNKEKSPLSLKACLRLSCQDVIAQQQTQSITFSFPAEVSGRFMATLESQDHIAYTPVAINVIQIPELALTDIKPSAVKYGTTPTITFTLTTSTPISNLILDFGFDQLKIATLKDKKEIQLSTSAKQLVNGFTFDIHYQDELGKKYTATKTLNVQVTNTPWYAKIIFSIMRWFQ